MYNQTNNVNIKPKSYLPEFHVSQNDVGRTLTAHLVSDEGDISIPAGATVTMAGTKPSGLGYTVTGTIDGSDVSFDTDAVMTDEPGRIVSEIRIVQGGTLIGTTNVVLSVEPNPHPDDTTDGRREPLVNEITALLTQITEQADRVEEYSGKVLNMTVTAHESDEATVTKTEGEVVNLDFGLPRGPQGPQGIPGEDGEDGVTPDFTIGTVETLAPGEQATATITGTEEDPVLNLGIPQGPKGDKGDTGEVSLETLAKVMVSDTASGTIATFSDGSDVLPAKSVLVTLNPKQSGSGTPSPTNVRPISGWDEVETVVASGQLIDTSTNQNGAIDASGNEVANATFNRTDFIPIDKAKICINTTIASGYVIRVHGYSASKAWVQQIKAITTDGTNMLVEEDVPSGIAYVRVSYPIVGVDNTELWQADTYTTDLPQTVYGGTLDVVSGVLTVDRAKATYNGSEEWQKDADKSSGTIHRFYLANNDIKKYSDYTDVLIANKCGATNNYQYASSMTGDYAVTAYHITTNNDNWVYIFSKTIDTVDGIKAWLSETPLEVVYPLATPTTIQCDPQTVQTLMGDNNVWGGSGVSIDYYADTKLYIEKMLGA